jgi:hypothetical protein
MKFTVKLKNSWGEKKQKERKKPWFKNRGLGGKNHA